MKFALPLLASALLLATAMPAFADDTKSNAAPAAANSDASSSAPAADATSSSAESSAAAGAAARSSSSDDTGVSNSNSNAAPSGANVTARDPQTVLDALAADGYPGKLSKLDNVIIAPHNGGATWDVRSRKALSVARGMVQMMRGERPVGLCDPQIYADA